MAATANPTRVTYALNTDGVGMAQTIRLKNTRHVIEVDAVPAFGGKDRHPGPLAYALAALTSCSQATAQIVARELGLSIARMSFDLESEIDLARLVGAPETGLPDFQSVELHVTVHADGSPSEMDRLRSETERRCPVFQLFRRGGVPIRCQWTLKSAASLSPATAA
ncbi:MAG: OsmC family protein [Panacagrimonas sp.]